MEKEKRLTSKKGSPNPDASCLRILADSSRLEALQPRYCTDQSEDVGRATHTRGRATMPIIRS